MDERVRELQRVAGYCEEAVGRHGEAGGREKEVREREKVVELEQVIDK